MDEPQKDTSPSRNNSENPNKNISESNDNSEPTKDDSLRSLLIETTGGVLQNVDLDPKIRPCLKQVFHTLQETGEIKEQSIEPFIYELIVNQYSHLEIHDVFKKWKKYDWDSFSEILDGLTFSDGTIPCEQLQQDKLCFGCHTILDKDIIVKFAELHNVPHVVFLVDPHGSPFAFCEPQKLKTLGNQRSTLFQDFKRWFKLDIIDPLIPALRDLTLTLDKTKTTIAMNSLCLSALEASRRVETKEEDKTFTDKQQIDTLSIAYTLEKHIKENRADLSYYIALWVKEAGCPQEECQRIVHIFSKKTEEQQTFLTAINAAYTGNGQYTPTQTSGIYGLLLSEIDEYTAIGSYRRLIEYIGVPSPHPNDPVLAKTNFSLSKPSYFVNYPYRRSIFQLNMVKQEGKNKETGEKWISWIPEFDLRIIQASIRDITVIKSETTNDTLFRINFQTRSGECFIEEGAFDYILSSLKSQALITSEKQSKDALSAIIGELSAHKQVKIEKDERLEGFYLSNGKLQASPEYLDIPTKPELTEALLTFNKAINQYYKESKERTSKAVHIAKWMLMSAFFFTKKQLRAEKKAVALHTFLLIRGPGNAGKTDVARLFANFYKNVRKEINADAISTVARIGKNVCDSTLPLLVNEAYTLFNTNRHREARELLKSHFEDVIIRNKYINKTTYVQIRGASPLFFTSNFDVKFRGSAEQRRYERFDFTQSDKNAITKESKAKFDEFFNKESHKLSAIGTATYHALKQNIDLLKLPYLDLAEQILSDLYRQCGLDIPAWLFQRIDKEETEDSLAADIRRLITEYSIEMLNINRVQTYSKEGIFRFSDLTSRFTYLTDQRLKTDIYLIDGYYYITRGFVAFLADKDVGVASLKDLADILGGKHKRCNKGSYFNLWAVKIKQETLENIGVQPKVTTFSNEMKQYRQFFDDLSSRSWKETDGSFSSDNLYLLCKYDKDKEELERILKLLIKDKYIEEPRPGFYKISEPQNNFLQTEINKLVEQSIDISDLIWDSEKAVSDFFVTIFQKIPQDKLVKDAAPIDLLYQKARGHTAGGIKPGEFAKTIVYLLREAKIFEPKPGSGFFKPI